eukprot:scaffold189600_cov19-Prasinocladus_malaysianus.AAC.1
MAQGADGSIPVVSNFAAEASTSGAPHKPLRLEDITEDDLHNIGRPARAPELESLLADAQQDTYE